MFNSFTRIYAKKLEIFRINLMFLRKIKNQININNLIIAK